MLARLAEKGESMDYEAPVLEEVGRASDLIKAYAGPDIDGGGWELSLGGVYGTLEDA